jgi:hypothetical protein
MPKNSCIVPRSPRFAYAACAYGEQVLREDLEPDEPEKKIGKSLKKGVVASHASKRGVCCV